MIEAIAMVGVILTLLNVWVSRRVMRDELSSRTQHLAQLAFVWLVPIIGTLVTIQIQRKNVERSTGGNSESRDIADDWDAVIDRPALPIRQPIMLPQSRVLPPNHAFNRTVAGYLTR